MKEIRICSLLKSYTSLLSMPLILEGVKSWLSALLARLAALVSVCSECARVQHFTSPMNIDTSRLSMLSSI